MNSPLVLPVTLIIAGILAFMATTGLLPPALFRLWPVIFVILGIVGLLSLTQDEMLDEIKPVAKKKTSSKAKSSKKVASKEKASNKKTTKTKTSTKKTSKK